MKKSIRAIDKALNYFVEVLLLIMCLTVMWQVISRFVIHHPSAWSEEIARYLLVWIGFLGGAIGIREGSHMCLVFITDRIRNTTMRTLLHIFDYAVCMILGWVFIRYGYDYALSGFNRTMLAIHIPMAYIYAVIPISGVIIIVNCLRLILADVKIIREKPIPES